MTFYFSQSVWLKGTFKVSWKKSLLQPKCIKALLLLLLLLLLLFLFDRQQERAYKGYNFQLQMKAKPHSS